MVQKFNEVIESKKPVIDESEFVNLKHLTVRYRTCMLPLGLENGLVTHIIGCMRWRAYPLVINTPSNQEDSSGAYVQSNQAI